MSPRPRAGARWVSRSKEQTSRTAAPTVRALEASLVRARPVQWGRVRVLGGLLEQAQDLTTKYLLELEPDRMLAYYRIGWACAKS